MNNITYLKNVSEVITKGTTPTSVGCDFTLDGINFIKSESICDSKYLESSAFMKINNKTDEKLKRSRLQEGDLLFSIAGAYLGKLGIVRVKDLPANTNQAVGIVRVKKKLVDVDYLYYYFSQSHINSYINKLSAQSSQPNLSLDLLGSLKFNYLPLDDQKRISAVLSSIDNKIELNNCINFELEAMAKILYDYWFVQFDFPDAKGKPYKTSGGKVVYNPTLKREIPEGWSVKTIQSIEPKIVTGKTPSKEHSHYFDGSVPFITIGDIRGNTYITSTEETLSIEGANTQKSKFLPEDTICVSCIASPGLVGFVTQPSQTNQQINSVICMNNVNRYFLYFAINAFFSGSKAKTGNTFANMNKEDFSNINLLYPEIELLTKFHETVDSMFKNIKTRSKENYHLKTMRDWLLPMLMNGQVKVI